jgi:hypothetical protein
MKNGEFPDALIICDVGHADRLQSAPDGSFSNSNRQLTSSMKKFQRWTLRLYSLSLLAGFPILMNAQTAQTIHWTAPDTNTILLLNQAYNLSATASSGLPVSFRLLGGAAILANNTVTATNVGTITLVAEQSGNGTFAPASEVRVFNRDNAVLQPTAWLGTIQGDANLVQVEPDHYV